jgi:hypothetical protein
MNNYAGMFIVSSSIVLMYFKQSHALIQCQPKHLFFFHSKRSGSFLYHKEDIPQRLHDGVRNKTETKQKLHGLISCM